MRREPRHSKTLLLSFSSLFLLSLFLLSLILFSAASVASDGKGYRKVLKESTRKARVYVWDNLEARVIWSATWLSDDFRAARRAKLGRLYRWTDKEKTRQEEKDREESERFDLFFLAVYAGSSQWPEIGKNEGQWRIVLDVPPHEPVEAIRLDRIPVTVIERTLYPYLDRWSQAYVVRFPRTIRKGGPFWLRMAGLPAPSELVWK